MRDARSALPAQDFFHAVVGRHVDAGGASGERPKRPAIRLIAEIKKASPSAGVIRPTFEPAELARLLERAGASALSVLTDATYFQGDLSYIGEVRRAAALPILRKDFILEDYQVYESRAAGADAILLIAAILTPQEMESLGRAAAGLGLGLLIEVHDETELRRVLPLVSTIPGAVLGINNRDLHAQRTDLSTTQRLAALIPSGTPFVAESGIRTGEDVARVRRAGACAALVGESLMRAADPAAVVRDLLQE